MPLTFLPLLSKAFTYSWPSYLWPFCPWPSRNRTGLWIQGTLTTSLPLVSVIGMEIAKIDASFLVWCRYLHSGPFYYSYNTWLHWYHNLGFFSSFSKCQWRCCQWPGCHSILFFSGISTSCPFYLSCLAPKTPHIGPEWSVSLFLTGFAFLRLDSLGRDSFAVVSWVCTFETVLLERRWPLGQQISESRTMTLDLRPALASVLTALCTISPKSMDFRSCCSILT